MNLMTVLERLLKDKLAQKDQLIETLRANVHALPAPRKCSKGSHMLVPQEQPCFDIEGHQPALKLVPVPITDLTPAQIIEARFRHKLSTMRGLAASIGLQAVFDLFCNDVRMALGR